MYRKLQSISLVLFDLNGPFGACSRPSGGWRVPARLVVHPHLGRHRPLHRELHCQLPVLPLLPPLQLREGALRLPVLLLP